MTTCLDNNFANLLKHHDTCLHSYSHVLRWVRVCDVVVDHLHRIASVASLLKTIYTLQFSVYSKRFHSYALWGVDCWRINLVPVVRRVGNWFCDGLQSAQPTWLMWSCWYSDVYHQVKRWIFWPLSSSSNLGGRGLAALGSGHFSTMFIDVTPGKISTWGVWYAIP